MLISALILQQAIQEQRQISKDQNLYEDMNITDSHESNSGIMNINEAYSSTV